VRTAGSRDKQPSHRHKLWCPPCDAAREAQQQN